MRAPSAYPCPVVIKAPTEQISAEVIILAISGVRLNTEAQRRSSPSVKPRTRGVYISSAGLNFQQMPPWEIDHLRGPDGFPNPSPVLNRKQVPARILGASLRNSQGLSLFYTGKVVV